MSLAIVWFRRDLRLSDNPAFRAACAQHDQVLPVYIHAPEEEAPWLPGGASRWWLHHSLTSLAKSLAAIQMPLHVCAGVSLDVLESLVAETQASAVYWNSLYEPQARRRDGEVAVALSQRGVGCCDFNASLWREPWETLNKAGSPYRVFTPFWHALEPELEKLSLTPSFRRVGGLRLDHGAPLETLGLRPQIQWDAGLARTWKPGERGAQACLDSFAEEAILGYALNRDYPALSSTSSLSPHLHFGEISPRQVVLGLRERLAEQGRFQADLTPFFRQLAWREFAHHLLYHFPHTDTTSFNGAFEAFDWASPDPEMLSRWQRGQTGIPLVDAGMRELWETGTMHNRVRMVVASFLTKNLRYHWRHGAQWFWDTLVDADLANNSLGWQWVAGSGADAAPYFRIFNPVTQSQKFDPQGVYLGHWLPELKALPPALRHEPWKDPSVHRQTGYPLPMVDLAQSRRSALTAYQKLTST